MPRIELDVFSGQPNPSWDLSPHEAKALTSRLTGLEHVSGHPVPEELGYRGFLISRLNGVDPRVWVRVFGGVLCFHHESVTRTYRDVHELEQWLREQARTKGYGDLLT